MKITDVRVRKLSDEGKLKSIVSVTMDECFVVHDIKLIEGQNGLFIAMPSRKIAEGKYRDIVHPINSETRQMLQDAIIAAYEEAKNKADETENPCACQLEEEKPETCQISDMCVNDDKKETEE